MKRRMKKFLNWQQEGVGIVEIILILVILIGLVLLFKTEISKIITDAFTSITGDAGKIN